MKNTKHGGKYIAKGFLDTKDGMYKFHNLPRQYSKLTTLLGQIDNHNKIWHERLEHLNFQILKMRKNMVVILPKVYPPNGVCEGCVLSKHHQEPFDSRKACRVNIPLELVHIDLCCIKKPSLGGSKYILTFIDDFSRFTRVYFFKNKSHVFEKFKKFKAFVEKQCDRPIKLCLRSDNGGAYVGRHFENCLSHNGIYCQILYLTHLIRMEW